MKTLLIISAFCLLGVFALPHPDQELKLEIDSLIKKDAVAAIEEKAENKTNQGTEPDRTRLLNDLLSKYNKGVNPDNVKLDFGLCLIDFHVREDRNAIDSYVWLRYAWQDPRLAWDPKEYGGVEVLRIDSTAIWKPDVTLYNSADPVNMVNCWDSSTVVYPTGKLIFVPPCKMTSTCNLKLKREPYGEQECSFKFGSWTLDGFAMDMNFYKGNSTMDLSQLHNSSGFEVLSTTGERNERFYPCCAEPYVDLTFNVTIKRVPGEELLRHF